MTARMTARQPSPTVRVVAVDQRPSGVSGGSVARPGRRPAPGEERLPEPRDGQGREKDVARGVVAELGSDRRRHEHELAPALPPQGIGHGEEGGGHEQQRHFLAVEERQVSEEGGEPDEVGHPQNGDPVREVAAGQCEDHDGTCGEQQLEEDLVDVGVVHVQEGRHLRRKQGDAQTGVVGVTERGHVPLALRRCELEDAVFQLDVVARDRPAA